MTITSRVLVTALVSAIFSALCVWVSAHGPDWVAPVMISLLACVVVVLAGLAIEYEVDLQQTEGRLAAAKQHALHERVTANVPQLLALQSLCAEAARALRHVAPESELGRLRERLRQAGE